MGTIDERVRKPLGSKCPKANEPCSHRVDDLCHEQGIGIECWIAACGVKDTEIEALKQRNAAVDKVLADLEAAGVVFPVALHGQDEYHGSLIDQESRAAPLNLIEDLVNAVAAQAEEGE